MTDGGRKTLTKRGREERERERERERKLTSKPAIDTMKTLFLCKCQSALK